MPIGDYAYWSQRRKHIFGRDDTNGIAEVDASTRTELGGALMCERRTGFTDHGRPSRKRCRRLHLVMRRGTSGASGTPDALEVRVQDDGTAWSPWMQASVGNDGADWRADFFPGGVYWRRRYDIRYAGSDDTSLVAMYEDFKDLREF